LCISIADKIADLELATRDFAIGDLRVRFCFVMLNINHYSQVLKYQFSASKQHYKFILVKHAEAQTKDTRCPTLLRF